MEGNELIAEFMGLEKENGLYLFTTPMDDYKTDTLYFDTSWDWLMPVVEKIECTSTDNKDNSDSFFNVMIEVFECNINGGNICICESGHNKKEATYQAVVEFIKQYNKYKL